MVNVFGSLILASEEITPAVSSGAFWNTLGMFFVNLGAMILNGIAHLAYYICRFALHIIDFMQLLVQKLAGVEAWVHLEKLDLNNLQETDVVFRFLLSDRVQQVFRTMVALFFVLLLVFSIVAIIKNEYGAATDGKEVDHKKTWYTAFKAVISVALVPVLLIGGILTSNAILASLMKAFNVNSALSMGGQVFVSSAYSASSYRMYATNGVRKPVSNITKYTSHNGNTYMIDTAIHVEKPKDDRTFSGYMFTFNGTDYFLWKASKEEEWSGSTFVGKNYFYLKYVLGAYIVEQNPRMTNFAGATATDTQLNHYKKYYDKVENSTIITKCREGYEKKYLTYHMTTYGFVDDFNINDLNASDEGRGVNILRAVYNTWTYNSKLEDGVSGWKNEDTLGAGMNTIDAKLESYITNSGVTKTAYTINNSKEWGRLHDGGIDGYSPLSVEYLVMADVIDFALGEDIPLYIVNANNSNITYNYGNAAGSFDQNTRYVNRAGLTEKGFLVGYDVGTVGYPVVDANNEIEGGLFIVCYYNSKINKYVPLTNGIKMFDDYGNSHTFHSAYYTNDYHGVIVARGIFESSLTMSFVGNALTPTYISQESPLMGSTPENYDNRTMLSAFLENLQVNDTNEYNYTYLEKLTDATDSNITSYSDAKSGDLVYNNAAGIKALYYYNDDTISATNRGNMAQTLWNKMSPYLTGFSLYSDGSYYISDLAADGQFVPGDTFVMQLKYGSEAQRYDLRIRFAEETNNIKAQDGSGRADIYKQTFNIESFNMYGNSAMPTAPVKAFEQIFAGDPATDTNYAYEVVSRSTGETTAPIMVLNMYDKNIGTNRNAFIQPESATSSQNIIKAVLRVINASGNKTYGFVTGSYQIGEDTESFSVDEQKFSITLKVYDTAFSDNGTATGNYVAGCKTYTVKLTKLAAADANVIANVGGTEVNYTFRHSFKITIDDTEASHLSVLDDFNGTFDRLLAGTLTTQIVTGDSTANVINYDNKMHFFATDSQFDTYDHALQSTGKLAQKVASSLAAQGYTLVNEGTIVNGVVTPLTVVTSASKTEYAATFVIRYQDENGYHFDLYYNATIVNPIDYIKSTGMYLDGVAREENKIYDRIISLDYNVQNTFRMHFASVSEVFGQNEGEFAPNANSVIKDSDNNTIVITARELTYVSGQDFYEFYVGEEGHVEVGTVGVSRYSYTTQKEINGKPVTETYLFHASTSSNGKVDNGLKFMGYTYTKVDSEYKYVVNKMNARVGTDTYALSESQTKQLFYGYSHTQIVQLPDYVWVEKRMEGTETKYYYHFINAEDVSMNSFYEYIIEGSVLNTLPSLDFGKENDNTTNPINAFTNAIEINQYDIDSATTVTKNATYANNFEKYKAGSSTETDYTKRDDGDNMNKIKADIADDIENASAYVRTHVNISIDWMPLISFADYQISGDGGDTSITFTVSATGLYGTTYNLRATNIDSVKNKYTEDKQKRNDSTHTKNYGDYDKVLKAYQNEFILYMTSMDVGTTQNLHSATVEATTEQTSEQTTMNMMKDLIQNPTRINFCRDKISNQWIDADIYFNITWTVLVPHFHFRFHLGSSFRRSKAAFTTAGAIQHNVIKTINRGVIALDYGFAGPLSVDNLYQVANINWIVLVFAIVIIFGILGNAVWGLIRRIYQITLLFLVSPAVASTMPIDEKGTRFNTWRTKIISEVLGAYGVCLGLNFFFIIIPVIRDASAIFTKADFASLSVGLRGFLISVGNLNGLVYMLFLLVALTLLKTVPAFVMSMLGEYGKSDVIDEGSKTKGAVKSTLSEAGKSISGENLVTSITQLSGDMKKMVPGKAIYDKVRDKIKSNADAKKKAEEEKKEKYNKNAMSEDIGSRMESVLNEAEEAVSETESEAGETPVVETTTPLTTGEGETTPPVEFAPPIDEDGTTSPVQDVNNGERREIQLEAEKLDNIHAKSAEVAYSAGKSKFSEASGLDDKKAEDAINKLAGEVGQRVDEVDKHVEDAFKLVDENTAKIDENLAETQETVNKVIDDTKKVVDAAVTAEQAAEASKISAAAAKQVSDIAKAQAQQADNKVQKELGAKKLAEKAGTKADKNKEGINVVAGAVKEVANSVAGKGRDYYQEEKDKKKQELEDAKQAERQARQDVRNDAALERQARKEEHKAEKETAKAEKLEAKNNDVKLQIDKLRKDAESGKLKGNLSKADIERWNKAHPDQIIKSMKEFKTMTAEEKEAQREIMRKARQEAYRHDKLLLARDLENGVKHGLLASVKRKLGGGEKTGKQKEKEQEKLAQAQENLAVLQRGGNFGESPIKHAKRLKKAENLVKRLQKATGEEKTGALYNMGKGAKFTTKKFKELGGWLGARFGQFGSWVKTKGAPKAGRFFKKVGKYAGIGIAGLAGVVTSPVWGPIFGAIKGGQALMKKYKASEFYRKKQDKKEFKKQEKAREKIRKDTIKKQKAAAKEIRRQDRRDEISKRVKMFKTSIKTAFDKFVKSPPMQSMITAAVSTARGIKFAAGATARGVRDTFVGMGTSLAAGAKLVGKGFKKVGKGFVNFGRGVGELAGDVKSWINKNVDKVVTKMKGTVAYQYLADKALNMKNIALKRKRDKKVEADGLSQSAMKRVYEDIENKIGGRQKVSLKGKVEKELKRSKAANEHRKSANEHRTKADDIRSTMKNQTYNFAALAEARKKAKKDLADFNKNAFKDLPESIKKAAEKRINDARLAGKNVGPEMMNRILRSEIEKAIRERERRTTSIINPQIDQLRRQLSGLASSSNAYRKQLKKIQSEGRKKKLTEPQQNHFGQQ